MKEKLLLSFLPFGILLTIIFYSRSFEFTIFTEKESQIRVLDQTTVNIVCNGENPEANFDESQIQESTNFEDSIKVMRGSDNQLIDFINNNNEQDNFHNDYISPLVTFSAVWITFFSLSIAYYVGLFLHWSFLYVKKLEHFGQRHCKLCMSPRKAKFKNFFMIGATFFGLSVVASSLAAIILSGGMPIGSKESTCYAVSSLNDFIEGNSELNWIGVSPLNDQVKNFSADYSNIIAGLPVFVPSYTLLNQYYTDTLNEIINLEIAATTGQSVTRPDPAIGGTYLPTYSSNAGPYTDNQTYTGQIYAEVNNKFVQIQNATTTLYQDIHTVDGINIASLTGVNGIDESTKELNQMLQNLASYSTYLINTYDYLGIAIMSIFVANLVAALVALGSISLIVFCGLPFFSRFTHGSWMALGVLSPLIWALAAIVFPSSVVVMETCGALKEAQSNGTFFLKAAEVFAPQQPNGAALMFQCMFNETRPLNYYGLIQTLDYFDQMYNITQDNTEFYSIDPNVTLVNSTVLPNQETFLSNVRIGRWADSSQTMTDLSTLNSLTNLTFGCSVSHDYWAFNNLNCTSGYAFQINDEDYTNFGSLTCIGFNIWMSNGNQISDRYNGSTFPNSGVPMPCPSKNGVSYYAYLDSFINNYVQNRNQIATNHGLLIQNLTNVITANNEFMGAVQAEAQPFVQANQTLQGLTTILYGQGGLLTNNNCSYFRESFYNMSELVCVSMIGPTYQTSIAIAITGFFTMFATFFLFCLSKQLSLKSEDEARKKKHVKMRDLSMKEADASQFL